MLTNKAIADGLRVPLTRVRRWAKEFLPPDPKATRQSGYIREYSDNDGWFVYISGIIMETTGFTFRQTAKVMDNVLKPWMLRTGMVPVLSGIPQLDGVDCEFSFDIGVQFYPNYPSEALGIPTIRIEGKKPSGLTSYIEKKTEQGLYAFAKEEKVIAWLTLPQEESPKMKLTKRIYYSEKSAPFVPIYSELSHFMFSLFDHAKRDKWYYAYAHIHRQRHPYLHESKTHLFDTVRHTWNLMIKGT